MLDNDRTLYEHLSAYAAEWPDKQMLGGKEGWLSVGQVLALAERCAGFFLEQGIRAGDLAALRAARDVPTILALLGLRFAGAVVVLTDPRVEITDALETAAVHIPVTASVQVIGGDIQFTARGQVVSTDLRSLPERSAALSAYHAQDAGFIIFTSGTTGNTKAVMLSDRNLISNLIDSQPLGLYSEDDIALGALPLDHVFGLVLLAGTIALRYAIYLPEATDIATLLQTIETEGITRMNGVPSLYLAMAAEREGYDLSSLRAGFIGGGPVTADQFCRVERALSMTLIPVYGMSECIGISCASWRDPQAVRASSVGPFYSMNTGKILREDGTQCVPGEEGEICVDGPARMVGYYGDDSPREPLLHTGDLGYVDGSGVLHISGRKKDIVIRNGRNLSTKKIEAALLSLPGVQDAAVAGVPDDVQGEIPYAMVVCSVPVEGILSALAPLLQKNELPARIMRMDAIPLTRSGKPDRQKIREVLRTWEIG